MGHDNGDEAESSKRDVLKVTAGSLCRTFALIATNSRQKTTFGGSLLDTGKINAIGGERRAAASTIGEIPT